MSAPSGMEDHTIDNMFGSSTSLPQTPAGLSLSFDTLMSTESSRARKPIHEIVVVHGFGLLGDSFRAHPQHYPTFGRTIGSDEHPHYYQARHVLEEWIQDAAETLSEPVNVRRMSFSTAQVMQLGKPVLCAAAHRLCNSLMELTLDESSPLFLGDQGDGDGEGSHFYSESAGGLLPVFRSRRVTFVAHGLGIWVVKQALLWFDFHGTPLHPAATFFFDGARITSTDMVPGYLHDAASLFALQQGNLRGAMLEDLVCHLFVIEQHFDTLMSEHYGECAEIKDADTDEARHRYEMVQCNHQLWHHPSPPLQAWGETHAHHHARLFARGDDHVLEQVGRLAFLELARHLGEAVSGNHLKSLQALPPVAEAAQRRARTDVDSTTLHNDDYDNASVVSSSSRYSEGDGPVAKTLPDGLESQQTEFPWEPPNETLPQASPTGSEWPDLLVSESGVRGTSGMSISSAREQAVNVPDDWLRLSDHQSTAAQGTASSQIPRNESHNHMRSHNNSYGLYSHNSPANLAGNRDTFDSLAIEKYIGRSGGPPKSNPDISGVTGYSYLGGNSMLANLPSSEPLTIGASEDAPQSEMLIDFEHEESAATVSKSASGAASNRSHRPRGPLSWATMSSRSPAIRGEDEQGEQHSPKTSPGRPQGLLGMIDMSSHSPAPVDTEARNQACAQYQSPREPLDVATMSSSMQAENRISQSSSAGGDSTTTESVLRLYGENALRDFTDLQRPISVSVRHTVAESMTARGSTAPGNLIAPCAPVHATAPTDELRKEPSGNMLEQALRELDSVDAGNLELEALDAFIAQLAVSVEAQLPGLDRKWPNIRRTLRWLLRDIELARYQAHSMREQQQPNSTPENERVTLGRGGPGEESVARENHRICDSREAKEGVYSSNQHGSIRAPEQAPSATEIGRKGFNYHQGYSKTREPEEILGDEYADDEDYS
ncbi:uncharacterized protein B0I36DRAFT_368543 [Microdochium trichocladiopsis]|uniref:Uncharacterized protein n=1 Tax=Microdochium trichocladiopsis TaxID=1682393 RepID=A0A9P9BJV2_9PEZI|nr:uncharacterized protein B0I36DRAFT_368543 [Microdochium trichocladiopsis]KAH7018528.1 hypothetical protein B0I36DRAFT_368543 [Microdochium trichocladiopsis]